MGVHSPPEPQVPRQESKPHQEKVTSEPGRGKSSTWRGLAMHQGGMQLRNCMSNSSPLRQSLEDKEAAYTLSLSLSMLLITC